MINKFDSIENITDEQLTHVFTIKQKKFKRYPIVYGKKDPIKVEYMQCPRCKNELHQTKINKEPTSNQICCCICLFVTGCYIACCLPFCFKKNYNVMHRCECCGEFYGESGV